MRRLALLAVLLPLLATAPAQAKVSCGDGVPMFADGKLRVFGVPFRSRDEWGANHYACFGGRRPQLVGSDYDNAGTGSAHTLVYAHAGRFLATYDYEDGEGGPDSDVSVVDLRRRRMVSFLNLACCEGVPPLRLARDGTLALIAPGDGVLVRAPGRRARALSGEDARDLAMYGGTVYWTEDGTARSAALDGVGGGEATALEPVRARRRGGACRAARGRTIVASGSVRVYATPRGRFACRVGERSFELAGSTPPRIVGDRWLLAFGEGGARVVDSRTGRTVARAGAVSQATALRDGTLAWIDIDGKVLVRSPGAQPVVLAPAGASALAAARRAVYWTESGITRVYRPPSEARSVSKPG